MNLLNALKNRFPDGIDYDDAVNLCMAFYCGGKYRSFCDDDALSMQHLADVFASLAKEGLIQSYAQHKAILFGANYHLIEDKGHWIEIQASILKLGTSYDHQRVDALLGGKISKLGGQGKLKAVIRRIFSLHR